jgi:hypothetical protein
LTTPSPYLSTIDNLGNSLNYTVLNSTPNVWHNLTIFITPSLSNRYLKVSVGWSFDDIESMALFDEFKFYTLDLQDAYEPYWTTRANEALKYCGVGYSVCSNDAYCFYTYTFTNTSSNNRQLLLCTDLEGYNVAVLNYQNYYSQARRILSQSNGQTADYCGDPHYDIIRTRDYFIISNNFVYAYGGPSYYYCSLGEKFVLEENSLLNVKITALDANTFHYGRASGTMTMYYNGTPQTSITVINSTPDSSLFGSHNTSFKETISVLPYSSTQTPSGTGWKMQTSGNATISSTFSFFSGTSVTCTPHSVCDPSTNNQTYINSDCSQSTPVYCGLCGCDAEGEYCNFPTQIGSVCDLNDPLHLGFNIYYSNCTTVYRTCNQNEVCNQETSQFGVNATLNYTTLNTICCYKQGTATVNYCFDEYGNNITYDQLITNISSSVSSSQSTNVFINPMNALALLIGGAFGYGTTESLATAQQISSMLISLFISMCLIIVITVKAEQRMNANNMFLLFIFTMLGLLIMFTFISWFPSWIMIVLIVISAIGFIKIGGIGQGG